MSTTEVQVPEWTLGDHLRKARETAGLSQQELANELGISQRSVTNYERNESVPKRPVLTVWAMRCGVPLKWLQETTTEQGIRTTARSCKTSASESLAA